jgi:hypothetical protein
MAGLRATEGCLATPLVKKDLVESRKQATIMLRLPTTVAGSITWEILGEIVSILPSLLFGHGAMG